MMIPKPKAGAAAAGVAGGLGAGSAQASDGGILGSGISWGDVGSFLLDFITPGGVGGTGGCSSDGVCGDMMPPRTGAGQQSIGAMSAGVPASPYSGNSGNSVARKK